MKNEYEIRGDVTAIIINSPKYGRLETLISTSKLEKVKLFPHAWGVKWNSFTQSFYVGGDSKNDDGKRINVRLHRWLTDATEGMQVDHFNNKTLDNTDDNLRIVTQGDNLQNPRGAYKNSKSGIRGVTWHERDRKWTAQYQLNRKIKHLGYFDSAEEAERAVIEARALHMPYSKEALAN